MMKGEVVKKVQLYITYNQHITMQYYPDAYALKRGGWRAVLMRNRFNGFSSVSETVETVSQFTATIFTPLKRGVNEIAIR